MKDVLKKSFEGKAEIRCMVEGNSMDKLCKIIMELIRDIYL